LSRTREAKRSERSQFDPVLFASREGMLWMLAWAGMTDGDAGTTDSLVPGHLDAAACCHRERAITLQPGGMTGSRIVRDDNRAPRR
jgi:hypothetical protein